MYFAETWTQTKASSTLKRGNVKAPRRIIGLTYKDRVTNEAVLKMTGLVELDKLQVRLRLRLCGHVHRRENDHAL